MKCPKCKKEINSDKCFMILSISNGTIYLEFNHTFDGTGCAHAGYWTMTFKTMTEDKK